MPQSIGPAALVSDNNSHKEALSCKNLDSLLVSDQHRPHLSVQLEENFAFAVFVEVAFREHDNVERLATLDLNLSLSHDGQFIHTLANAISRKTHSPPRTRTITRKLIDGFQAARK